MSKRSRASTKCPPQPLASAGERGRARLAACNSLPNLVTDDLVREIQQMYPDPDLDTIPEHLHDASHRSGPNHVPQALAPLGMRAEHLCLGSSVSPL